MSSFISYTIRFMSEEDGPTATEYGVMLALVVVVCIGAISGIGSKVSTTFTNLDSQLPTGAAS